MKSKLRISEGLTGAIEAAIAESFEEAAQEGSDRVESGCLNVVKEAKHYH